MGLILQQQGGPGTKSGTRSSQTGSADADAATLGGRNNWLTSRAGAYRREGDERDELAQKLHADNARLSQPLTLEEVDGIVNSAMSWEPDPDALARRRAIELVNQKYFWCENKHTAIYERASVADNSGKILSSSGLVWVKHAQMREAFEGEKISVPDGKKVHKLNPASLWLESKKYQRRFEDTMYIPPVRGVDMNCPVRIYNAWRGWGVEPNRSGSWKLLRKHLWENVAQRDRKLYRYLLGWLAHCVQFPDRPGEVALILRGREGGGKSYVGEVMCKLLGDHSSVIANRDDLVGRFNDHLDNKSFLLVEEAFFAGDPTINGPLKHMINGAKRKSEGKFKDKNTVANTLHILMSTNEEWAVPASLESRRYCMLDVKGFRSIDEAWAYFGPIRAQMNNGGYSCMLHDLLGRDLSKFKIQEFPVTSALEDQRAATLEKDTFKSWLLLAAENGTLSTHLSARMDLPDDTGWGGMLPTQYVFKNYLEYAQDSAERHPLTPVGFGRKLKNVLPAITKGRYIGRPPMSTVWLVYHLPPLSDARAALEQAWGVRITGVP